MSPEATTSGDHAALRDECEVALSIPFDKRSITHGDAFYEAVLALVTGYVCHACYMGEHDACGRQRGDFCTCDKPPHTASTPVVEQ